MPNEMEPVKHADHQGGEEVVPWGLIVQKLPEILREVNKQTEDAARRQAEL